MQMGRLEQKSHRLGIALEHFQQAAQHHTQKLEPQFATIDLAFRRGSIAQAKDCLEALLEKHPQEYRVLIQAGLLARKLGERGRAQEWFELAQQQACSPSEATKAKQRAIEELRELGDLERALESIEEIVRQFPQDIHSQAIKGSILQKMLDLSTAEVVYQDILALEPNHLHSIVELAKIHSQSGRVEAAIELLEHGYATIGENLQLMVQLGFLNQAIDNWSAARQWYEKIYAKYPYTHQGYVMLANLLFLQGEKKAALNLLQKARTKLPELVELSLKTIEIHTRLGNLDLAHQLLTQELTRSPYDVHLLWQLCRLHMDRGDYGDALATLDRITTDSPGLAGTH